MKILMLSDSQVSLLRSLLLTHVVSRDICGFKSLEAEKVLKLLPMEKKSKWNEGLGKVGGE